MTMHGLTNYKPLLLLSMCKVVMHLSQISCSLRFLSSQICLHQELFFLSKRRHITRRITCWHME